MCIVWKQMHYKICLPRKNSWITFSGQHMFMFRRRSPLTAAGSMTAVRLEPERKKCDVVIQPQSPQRSEVRGQRSGWLSAGQHWNAKHVHTLLSVLWYDFIVASKIHVTITAQFFWFYSPFFSADHHPCFLHTLRNILSSIACVICFWSSTEVQTELMFVQRAWLYSCHQTEPNEGVTQNKTKLVSLLYLAAITQNRF